MNYFDELESMAAAAANIDENAGQEHSEVFEYALGIAHGNQGGISQPVTRKALTPREARISYLVKLDDTLDSAGKIQQLTGVWELPPVVRGTGEFEDADFCLINGRMKREIEVALSHLPSRSTFVRINRADKKLSSCSVAPTLGCGHDITLPQHRADDSQHQFHPAQDEYPVWYFFYGTLANAEFLAQKLDLERLPNLRPAIVKGGIISNWGGKYKALKNGPPTATVNGWAYIVTSEEDEEQLRYFETDSYEVVRCDILRADTGETIRGLTFRFCDDVGE